MKYAFTCPISGCGEKMTTEAENDGQALDELVEIAKGHLAEKHPDLEKTEQEIHDDIEPKMVKEG